jgi:hypothetical protein
VPQLEPRHLFQKRAQRDTARLRSYNQLLEQIHTRIFSTSQLPGNPLYILYNVPPFILGLPSMDMQDCIVYLVHMLRTNGFEVRFTYPNLLYISWKDYEREYLLKANPIAQAMDGIRTAQKGRAPAAPAQTRSSRKETPGVRFNLAPQIDPTGFVPPPPRSANEYVPPDSFLDTLQRPKPKPTDSRSPNDVLSDLWKFA